MALTYEQSATLMKDPAFVNRVKVACLKFANYILDEPGNIPAHNTRTKWAQQTTTNPDNVAQTITAPVVMDGAVQAEGDTITDAALQSAVEGVVNKLL